MEREIAAARKENHSLLKVVHGYGSSGVGGDIRIAVQKRLAERVSAGEMQSCIFGEDWSKTSEQTWRLLQSQPELKNDPDLGRKNLGITIVVL